MSGISTNSFYPKQCWRFIFCLLIQLKNFQTSSIAYLLWTLWKIAFHIISSFLNPYLVLHSDHCCWNLARCCHTFLIPIFGVLVYFNFCVFCFVFKNIRNLVAAHLALHSTVILLPFCSSLPVVLAFFLSPFVLFNYFLIFPWFETFFFISNVRCLSFCFKLLRLFWYLIWHTLLLLWFFHRSQSWR